MEVDKRKKKRVTIGEMGEGERDRLKKLKGEEDGGAAGDGSGGGDDTMVVPTEEEVEEFYGILKRMRVAVKYFDEKGRGSGKEWRELLEQAEVTVVDDDENAVDDDDNHLEAGCAAVNKNKGFDLNAVSPEAADGSDA